MTLMYQRALESGTNDGMDGSIFKRLLRSAQGNVKCFDITNVAAYYDDVVEVKPQLDFYKAFPNIAPPFPDFWMEFPPSRKSTEFGLGATRIGIFMQGLDESDFRAHNRTPYESGVFDNARDMIADGEVKWVLMATPFIEYTDGIYGPFMSFACPVRANGIPHMEASAMTQGKRGIVSMLYPLGGGACRQIAAEHGNTEEEAQKMFAQMLAIESLFRGLLALSFLHCKGVIVSEHEQDVPRQHRRALARAGEKPPVRYNTLAIEPMRGTLEREGNISTNGLAHALHICRGHFRTYTAAKPMLGHYVGTVWVPSHVRGRDGDHVVETEYSVDAPNNTPVAGDIDSAFRLDGRRKVRGRKVH